MIARMKNSEQYKLEVKIKMSKEKIARLKEQVAKEEALKQKKANGQQNWISWLQNKIQINKK